MTYIRKKKSKKMMEEQKNSQELSFLKYMETEGMEESKTERSQSPPGIPAGKEAHKKEERLEVQRESDKTKNRRIKDNNTTCGDETL